MNSADMPPGVAPATPADPADRAYRADPGRPPQDPAADTGTPASVTGPVAPRAAAAGSHQPLARTSLTGGLLHQWQQRNLAASLPLALRQLEDAGNLDNVRLAIKANHEALLRAEGAADGRRLVGVGPVDPLPGTGYRGPVFMDSDIYKTLEAIGWELAHRSHPKNPENPEHPELGSFAARVTALLKEAQRPDGYLNSYFQVSGEPRYTRLAWSTISPRNLATRCTSTSTRGPGCPGRASTWRSPPTTRGPARSTCACSPRRGPGAGWPSGCRPGAPAPASR